MNRRKYLLGLGTATLAGGLSIGTEAFTAARVERNAHIGVSNDSESLIALVPNPRVSGVREVNGQIAIDLDDPGVNVNSIYQFGLFDDDWQSGTYDPNGDSFPLVEDEPDARDTDGEFGSAFLVENRTTDPIAIEMTFVVNEGDDESDAGDTKFVFQTHHDGNEKDTLVYDGESPPEMGLTVDELGSGEAFGVSFLVDAIDGAVGDVLDASVSVAAGEIVDTDPAEDRDNKEDDDDEDRADEEEEDELLAIDTVRFQGRGNGEINPDGPDGFVDAIVWRFGGTGNDRELVSLTPEGRIDTAEKLKQALGIGENLFLVAVVFPERNLAVVNDTWDGEETTNSENDGVRSDERPDLFEGVDLTDEDEFRSFLTGEDFPLGD